ncbi:MAG: heavy metal-binding domain-containing protein, partial [Methyloligellaceae bacterium]
MASHAEKETGCHTEEKKEHSSCCHDHQHHTAKSNIPDDPNAIYICPMHLEIEQVGPGTCPICGMALEPKAISLDQGPNPELADMTLRFWIGLALALPVFILEMGEHLFPGTVSSLISPQISVWVQFALAT